MNTLYVDSSEKLQAACRQFEGSRWLAVDTEFVREKTYFPQFCLLQIANDHCAVCIDPLAAGDLSDLQALLFEPDITKVFHAASQDLEIFYHQWQDIPGPIFDTQLAATLLGLGDQLGYAATVKATLGVELDKGQVRTDWRRRPLSELQLAYAFNDVIYLGQIYQSILQQLTTLGRADWLKEDLIRLADPRRYQIDPESQWRRIRGRQGLSDKQLQVLRALAAWRERRAVQADKPRKWILTDDVLLRLAKRLPHNETELSRVHGIDGKATRLASQLGQVIQDALSTPKEHWPAQRADMRPLTLQQEAITDLLMCVLKVRADGQQIRPAAICSRREIERLVRGAMDLEVLQGWRRRVVGEDLLLAMKGELHPQIIDGSIILSGAEQEKTPKSPRDSGVLV